MSIRWVKINIALSLFLLVLTLVIFETTALDTDIQALFFKAQTDSWLVDRKDPLIKFVFYNGIKGMLSTITVGILLALIFFREKPVIQCRKKELLIVLASAILIPSIVHYLKVLTDMPCPKDFSIYGGEVVYYRLFDIDMRPEKIYKCFPAAHAGQCFSALALIFLANTAKQRVIAAGVILVVASAGSTYKMLIGDHFLSHTLATLFISWFVIHVIAWIGYQPPGIFRQKKGPG